MLFKLGDFGFKKKKKKRGREKETEKHFLLARLLLSVSRGCFLDRQLLCLFFLTNSTMVSFSFFHISVFIFFLLPILCSKCCLQFLASVDICHLGTMHLLRELLRNWAGEGTNNGNFKGDSRWKKESYTVFSSSV